VSKIEDRCKNLDPGNGLTDGGSGRFGVQQGAIVLSRNGFVKSLLQEMVDAFFLAILNRIRLGIDRGGPLIRLARE
jgi:hypothetical protein